jgi:hypothetical protein
MQFTESNRYPFPAHAVVQVFGNKDYFIKKYTGAGATNIQVLEEQHNGSKTRIAVSRHVDIDIDVPAFARKFVPDTITVVQVDSWDQTTLRGHLDIQFKGMPAEDGRCVLNLNFSVNINVPLIGDKLAKVLGADLKKKFERDSHQAQEVMAEFVQRYL